MELLTKNTLKALAAVADPPCASVYLRLSRDPARWKENAQLLKAALSDVEQRLAMIGLSPKGRIQFLADARILAEEMAGRPADAEGIAVFLSSTAGHWFLLPASPKDLLFIGTRFLLTPLLPFVRTDDQYCVLAMSERSCRLIQVAGGTATEVPVPGMPASGAEAESDYLGEAAAALEQALSGQRTPLVFAGPEDVFAELRKRTSYPYLLDEHVPGSLDTLSPSLLRYLSLPLASAVLERTKDAALRAFEAAAGIGRTSVSAKDILAAAKEGRIAWLLLPEGAEQWGSVDPETGEVTVHVTREDKDEELGGLAATETLVRDGEVVVLPQARMPQGAGMAAVLRY